MSLVDFGAPGAVGAHVFQVEISRAASAHIVVVEDYGYRGEEDGIPAKEERVKLERWRWNGIAEAARQEFNLRLRKVNAAPGRWHVGTNKVDRLLGKELCVLAWAAETANEDQLPIIGSRWAALRPEERWWLFAMTVAEAGQPDDTGRGWRRALFHALSDGRGRSARRAPRPAEPEELQLTLGDAK